MGSAAFGHELIVVAVEVAEQTNSRSRREWSFAGFHAQRSGDLPEVGGHFRLVHVDADADDGVVHAVGLGVHLGEDAGEFLAVREEIVGPADVGERVELFGGGVARGEAGDQSEQGRVAPGRFAGAAKRCNDAGGFFGEPFAAGAAASGGLFFGENDGAVGLALFAELHGDGIGGIHFEEMVDAARERRAEQAMAESCGTRMSGARSM
jgi:hypothetical protein